MTVMSDDIGEKRAAARALGQRRREAVEAAIEILEEAYRYGPWTTLELQSGEDDGELHIMGTSDGVVALAIHLLYIEQQRHTDWTVNGGSFGSPWIRRWMRVSSPDRPQLSFEQVTVDVDNGLTPWDYYRRDEVVADFDRDWRSHVQIERADDDE